MAPTCAAPGSQPVCPAPCRAPAPGWPSERWSQPHLVGDATTNERFFVHRRGQRCEKAQGHAARCRRRWGWKAASSFSSGTCAQQLRTPELSPTPTHATPCFETCPLHQGLVAPAMETLTTIHMRKTHPPVSIMRSMSSSGMCWPVTVYTRRSTTSRYSSWICGQAKNGRRETGVKMRGSLQHTHLERTYKPPTCTGTQVAAVMA